MMTVDQVKAAAAALAAQISQLVQDFQTSTGTTVHSLPVVHDAKTTVVRVKVQIPE